MTSEAFYVLKLLACLLVFSFVCVTAGAVWACQRLIYDGNKEAK